uniref:VWFA domain-containing protein n=1 Tax=Eucampia antarctica TaxID=49252 RepID=A0A7S2WGJ3_9STRA|mmetsp:Transcript_29922/g.28802  ORF Transcript_29922/g.28802 Transcript_29922/m.28802 type:complete len:430 (+) Transcript_29922:127-1416(+)|eukprot:CAMPEP_0197838000 /NCGR_PEP_ID=MMETSP1437-20131217/33965_1 /TAXON_ID=49252 ORGANISM="Eucampia antarctica, Strain CCMP1452" /NCGR_SAMPLE_ID=MMETSP1437 /ASSEMBLY_ACC=CAM_ASM_001096 /LENGTH=429 /DNA_ID=CAMNT_0043445497 /DNA_START=69 /DNA_END=1358 /DNA_ORIENTATION=-
MVLESCMILVDNSEFMRNGDYIPSRLEAQHDAANLLVSQKTQSNPESTVGVIALCGSDGSGSAELLVSPTDDMGKILGALHGIPIRGGGYDVCASMQVASLALKHRRNKNGAQRVVLFVGSPLDSSVDKRALLKAGKLLKKNNVSIDVISMGEDNAEKLKDLVDAANGTTAEGEERTCHFVTIPVGVLPSDVLITSPIVRGGGGSGAASGSGPMDLSSGGGATDDFAQYGGVDPNMDPELAMALRVSMEEERSRQERLARVAAEQQQQGEEESKQDGATDMDVEEAKPDIPAPAAAVSAAVDEDEMGDEDALLQQALAMSMAEHHAAATNEDTEVEAKQQESTAIKNELDDDNEDAAMQMALQMSMATDNEQPSSQQQEQFQDPQFVNNLLGSLPGVNPNDPAIQSALSNLQQQTKDEDDKDKKDSEKK